MKYIVMETHNSYAVLLDENGRFFIAANLHYEVGETVENPAIMNEKPQVVPAKKEQKSKVRRLVPIASAAAAIVAVAAIAILFVMSNQEDTALVADSSIYLAVNPEFRIDLNDEQEVINVEGVNEDGEELLEDSDLEDLDYTEISVEMLEAMISESYLEDGGAVRFTIDGTDEQYQDYAEELRPIITEQLEGQVQDVTLEFINMNNPSMRTSQTIEESEESSQESSVETEDDDDDEVEESEEVEESLAPAPQPAPEPVPESSVQPQPEPQPDPQPAPTPAPQPEYDDDDDDYEVEESEVEIEDDDWDDDDGDDDYEVEESEEVDDDDDD